MNLRALVVALVVMSPPAAAASVSDLIAQLKDDTGAPAAIDALVAVGKPAVPALIVLARDGGNLSQRGRAIVALTAIGGADVDDALSRIKGPKLLESWAAAGRIKLAPSIDALSRLAPLARTYPSVARPLGMRLNQLLSSGENMSATQLLTISRAHTAFQKAVAPHVLAGGPAPLVEALTKSGDDDIRRLAAGFLATLANKNAEGVARAVIDAYRFDPKADDVPWSGGALFVPSLSWDRKEAKALVGGLIAWHLWCEINGKKNFQKQIHNNIRSLNLARAAGYQSPGWRDAGIDKWLRVWGAVVGKGEIEALLRAQGVQDAPRYRAIVRDL